LSDRQDAYGHQLHDCFKGKKVVEVVERDDGFIHTSAMYPRYYLSDYRDWQPHEKKQYDTQLEESLTLDAEAGESLSISRRDASMSLESTPRPWP